MPYDLVGKKARNIPSLSSSQELLLGLNPTFPHPAGTLCEDLPKEGGRKHLLPQEGW